MDRRLLKYLLGVVIAAVAGSHAHAQLLSENFSTLTDNTLPSGWTSSKASDLDYTTEPYVGAAGPAYKFSTSGQWLQSPTFTTGATGLQFWAYGNGGSGSTITVSGLVSGVWTLINSFSIAQNDGTYSVSMAAGTTQLKFSFTKVVNCAFDDVFVTGGGGGSTNTPPVLNSIGNKSVTASNSLQFTVTATPTDGDTVTLTASNLPSGAYFYPTNESGSFVWSSAAPAGSYNVTFNAADNDGFDDETITITVNPAGDGGGVGSLDVSGWSVIQSNATATFTFPAGTTAEPNNYIIIGRYADQAAFEAAWGVTLSNNVLYLNSGNTMPQINGSEIYGLYNAASLLVDGATPATLNPSGNSIQRTTLSGDASDAGNWSSSAMANATPGTGASGNGTAGLRISEYSDASNWSNEFVELFYDASSSTPSNLPPVLASIGNKTTEETVQLQFSVSATDPVDGDAITLSVSNAPSGSSFSSTNGNGTFTWTLPTPDGVYTTIFYAADKDGVDSESITITVTPPAAGVTSNFWHFEDDWQYWTNYSRLSNQNWSRANLAGAESTAWKMEINGYGADTSSDDWLISPHLDLSAVTDPIITYWTMREYTGNDIQVKISTNYPGTGDPLDSGVSWATLSYTRPSSLSTWAQHTNDLSSYVGHTNIYVAFYYTATPTAAARWSVDQIRYNATAANSNAPPVLASIGNKFLYVSNNLSFTIYAADPIDDDTITLTASNLPSGATFTPTNNSGSFYWPNASPVGIYTSSFYAADKDGIDYETITITISEPPGPTNIPVLTAIGNKAVIESNSLQFAVTASDLDGDTITLSASNLPSGAMFTSTNASGNFNWPNATPDGTYTARFYAADNDGADWESVVIRVGAVAPTGTIVFQGFDSSTNDTWNFSGGGNTLAEAARTDGYGRKIGGSESLIFSNVDLLGHSSVMLHIHCASTGGIENLDSLLIYVAFDGAAFSTTPDVTIQEGNLTDAVYNLTWPYSASGIASSLAGTPETFNGDGDSGYATIRVRIPDGSSSMNLKIASDTSSTNESFYLDDVELTSGSWDFNDPPSLDSIGSQSGSIGESLIFTVSASDPDDDPITLTASNLPAGAVFVDQGSGAGNFTWASPGIVGVYTCSFYAITADGSDSEQITITIGAASSSSNVTVTIAGANTTSGTSQSYEAPGIRIFQALKPDVTCIQEFNYNSGTYRDFVDTAFGTNYSYYCEGGGEQIPNGIISKYPILSSGEWEDTYVSNRDFAWAIIDIPGTQDLYVVSVHLLTTSATVRNDEAILLRSYITNNWPSSALIAIAGDFNTVNRSESCLSTFATMSFTDEKQPKDQNGDMDTNAGRTSDYDWVLPNAALNAKHTNTVVGGTTFTAGIVFDTRLAAWGANLPSPALSTDSGELNMQHMLVMKTYQLAAASVAPTSATIYTISGAGGTISPVNPVISLGGSKTLTISNSVGYVISDVQIDGVSIGATNTYTFTSVTNSRSIAATFQADASMQLVITDLNGPGSGSVTNDVANGSSQRCTNNNLTITYGTTQFVLKGWTGTGSAPASGTTNVTASFTMAQNSSVKWLWSTSYWFDSAAAANGSVNTGDQWVPSGSNVTITATPNSYYNFSVWTGNPPGGQETNNPVTVAMTSPKALTANFTERLAINNVPEWWLASYGWISDFDNNALGDQDIDGALTWQEYYAGTIPTNAASKFSVQIAPKISAPNLAILTWPSATGRTYYIEVKSNVVTDTWAPYLSNVPATPPLNTHTGTWTTTDRVYFRIEVRKP